MRTVCLSALLSAALLFALPLLAQDAKKPDVPGAKDVKKDQDKKPFELPTEVKDKKPDDKKPDTKKPDDKTTDKDKKKPDDTKKKLNLGLIFSGKIQKLDVSGEVTLQVTTKLQVPHADAGQRAFNYQKSLVDRQNDLNQRLVNIQRERNPGQRQNLINDYYRVLNSPLPKPPELYYIKEQNNDVIVRLGKDVIVRNSTPEIQYNDKGEIVPLTPKKLKELQGPEGYPGFPATISDLRTGQTVSVGLAPFKGKPGTNTDKKKKTTVADIIGNAKEGKEGKEGGGDELVNPNIPEVVIIMVTKDNNQ